MKSIIITGGSGFIGSNFIKHIMGTTSGVGIINIDLLTYAGNPLNLKDIESDKRYTFIKGDINNKDLIRSIINTCDVEGIINFAAESHVDKSIMSSIPFITTNIKGTTVLLDVIKETGINRFVQVSTDEVYGSLTLGEPAFTEESTIKPGNPYAASKASADLIALSYFNTFKLPITITRCSNNYGPFQFPEKLIPLVINNAINGKEIPIYGTGENIRDWIHVNDHCSAIWSIYNKGKEGNVYNIGSSNEITNIELVKHILKVLDKPESLITYVKDRPGHDLRYAINSNRLRKETGWCPSYNWKEGIKETINWYINNKEWIDSTINKDYIEYYNKQYKKDN